MSTVAKLFIILNLLVAFAVAAFSVAGYAKRIYWVEQTHEAMEEAKTLYKEKEEMRMAKDERIKTLETEVQSKDAEVRRLADEKTALAADNARLNSQVSKLDVTLDGIRSTTQSLQAIIDKKENRNEGLQEPLNAEIKKNTKFLNDVEFAQKRAIESMADLKEAEAELMRLAKSNAELVRKNTILAKQVETYVAQYGPNPDMNVSPATRITGRVLQVEPEIDLVILSVGSRDKVEKGMEFVISRGEDYVAKVRVVNTFDDMSSARVLDGMSKTVIEVSDSAQTL